MRRRYVTRGINKVLSRDSVNQFCWSDPPCSLLFRHNDEVPLPQADATKRLLGPDLIAQPIKSLARTRPSRMHQP